MSYFTYIFMIMFWCWLVYFNYDKWDVYVYKEIYNISMLICWKQTIKMLASFSQKSNGLLLASFLL